MNLDPCFAKGPYLQVSQTPAPDLHTQMLARSSFGLGSEFFSLRLTDLRSCSLKRLDCRQGAVKPRFCARFKQMMLSPTPPN